MLKLVAIILFISLKPCYGFTIQDLQDVNTKVRTLSIKLLYFTDKETEETLIMAPFTVWNLFFFVAVRTTDESWSQLHSIIPTQDDQYYNTIFSIITEGMTYPSSRTSKQAFKSKLLVIYDKSLELSKSFESSIVNSGLHLKMLNFDDNVLAAKLANEYIQVSNYSLTPKQLVFDKSDFEKSIMIVSGLVEFNAEWYSPFQESNTILKNWDNGSGYMMYQKAEIKSLDMEELGASVLELKYKDPGYSMVVIRPHENVTIQDVLLNFDKISFRNMLNELFLNVRPLEMDVDLPRFSLTSVLILNDPFKSMNARDIFLSDRANFRIASNEDLYISAFEQRAVVTVSETGTAAMASIPANLAEGTKESELGTAPPFLFFIIHKSSYSIVFCGKYGR